MATEEPETGGFPDELTLEDYADDWVALEETAEGDDEGLAHLLMAKYPNLDTDYLDVNEAYKNSNEFAVAERKWIEEFHDRLHHYHELAHREKISLEAGHVTGDWKNHIVGFPPDGFDQYGVPSGDPNDPKNIYHYPSKIRRAEIVNLRKWFRAPENRKRAQKYETLLEQGYRDEHSELAHIDQTRESDGMARNQKLLRSNIHRNSDIVAGAKKIVQKDFALKTDKNEVPVNAGWNAVIMNAIVGNADAWRAIPDGVDNFEALPRELQNELLQTVDFINESWYKFHMREKVATHSQFMTPSSILLWGRGDRDTQTTKNILNRSGMKHIFSKDGHLGYMFGANKKSRNKQRIFCQLMTSKAEWGADAMYKRRYYNPAIFFAYNDNLALQDKPPNIEPAPAPAVPPGGTYFQDAIRKELLKSRPKLPIQQVDPMEKTYKARPRRKQIEQHREDAQRRVAIEARGRKELKRENQKAEDTRELGQRVTGLHNQIRKMENQGRRFEKSLDMLYKKRATIVGPQGLVGSRKDFDANKAKILQLQQKRQIHSEHILGLKRQLLQYEKQREPPVPRSKFSQDDEKAPRSQEDEKAQSPPERVTAIPMRINRTPVDLSTPEKPELTTDQRQPPPDVVEIVHIPDSPPAAPEQPPAPVPPTPVPDTPPPRPPSRPASPGGVQQFIQQNQPINVNVPVPQVVAQPSNEEKQDEMDALDYMMKRSKLSKEFIKKHFQFHKQSKTYRAVPQRQYIFRQPVYSMENEYIIPAYVEREEVMFDRWDFHTKETYDNPDPYTSYRNFEKFNQANYPLYSVSGRLHGTLGDFFHFKGGGRTIHVYKVSKPPPQAIDILSKRLLEHVQHQAGVRLLRVTKYKGRTKITTLFSDKLLSKMTHAELHMELEKYFATHRHMVLKQTSVGGPLHQLLKRNNSIL